MTVHDRSQSEEGGKQSNPTKTDPDDAETGATDNQSTVMEGGRLPKIAFFTPAPTYGGAQRVTINIANSLAARGHDIELVVGNLHGEFADDINDAVETIDLEIPRVPGLGILAGIQHLRSYLKSTRPRILFSSRTHTNIAAISAARLTDVDVYVAATEHSDYGQVEDFKGKLTTALAAQTYRFADDIVAVSRGVAKSVVQNTPVSTEGTTVLHNPVDIEDVQATAKEDPGHEWLTNPTLETVVSVGRLRKQKDVATLLRAIATLKETRPEVRLIVVGKGPKREQLESLAASLGIRDSVSFEGYVENPYAYMHSSSVFALSSRYEGLPTVLIEALACGSSIVSTDCPHGPREVLVDGEYGWLTPVGDHEALAATINDALENPTPAAKSRERAEDFSMDAGADRYERYARQVIDGS